MSDKNEVKVEQKPWYQRIWEDTPGARRLAIERGEVPGALQQPQQQPEQKYGLPGIISGIGDARNQFNRGFYNLSDQFGRWVTGAGPTNAPLLGDLMYDPGSAYGKLGPSTLTPSEIITRVSQIPASQRAAIEGSYTGRKDYPNQAARAADEAFLSQLAASRAAETEEPATQTFEQWLAENTGTFDSTPYDNYAASLAALDEETLARINAMYAQLANEAEANMERVANVYEGAERGVGEAYSGAEDLIGQAYASAQQQAADQMARLGLEEAAPAVINPAALSQAEALSNIATGQGAALGATRQFGATAQDFASQMGQVGQQQGFEVSNQILRDMARRQADLAFQRAQAEANYNPYAQAIQLMELEQAWGAPQAEAERFQQEQALELAKEQIKAQSQYDNELMANIIDIMNQGYTYDEAAEIVANTRTYNPFQ